MINPRWVSFGLLTIAVAGGVGFAMQRQVNANLRAEVARLQEQRHEWSHVRSEHERLSRNRVSEVELARLRVDHAALARLRGEVAEMKLRVAARQAAVEKPVAAPRVPVVNTPATLAFKIDIGADGLLRVDGSPSEIAALQQRLAALMRGARVEVLLAGDPTQHEKVSQTSRQLLAFAKEHGLRMELKFGGARR